MAQTYRTDDMARWGTGQGFNLTPAQVDINFWDLIQRMIAQEARPDPSAGISHFSISGVMMYVHMTDDTVLGPYELPVAVFRDRGEWAPGVAYSVMDTFSINGGLWVVIFAHTSEATFDPGANDGAGNDYYQLMLQTPGSSLPGGGAVGQLLVKATETDYSVMWGYTDAVDVTFTAATGSPLTSINVADALDELAAGGGGGITSAADVTYTPSTASGLTSDNVQDALDELGSAPGGGGGSTIGRHTIWVPALAMVARTTNGPAAGTVELGTHKNMLKTLDFDSAAAEYAQFDVAFPKSWNKGNIKFVAYWSHSGGVTNFDVAWQLAGHGLYNNAAMDAAFGTAVTVTDSSDGTSNQMWVTAASADVNIGGGGVTDDNMMILRINRNPADGGDTLGVDARLHGVKIFYTTSAETDD